MTFISFVGLFVFWQVAVWGFSVPIYVLPAPLDIVMALVRHCPLIAQHFLTSFLEIFLGLVLGVGVGVMMGGILHFLPRVKQCIMPLIIFCQSIPMFALLPLLTLWLGRGWGPKVLVIALTVYFPVIVAFLEGLARVPQSWYEQARLFRGKPWSIFFKMELPCALPHLFGGLKVAFVTAPLAVMAADWIGADAGLGYLILYSAGRLELALMFSGIFALGFLSLVFFKILKFAQKRFITWPASSV